MVRWIVRLEGAAVFLLSLFLYQRFSFNSWLFLILILSPDLSLAAYFFGKKVGSIAYNFVHNYVLAGFLVWLGIATDRHLLLGLGLVLTAHIGADRFLGFGLKYPANFKETHVQKL